MAEHGADANAVDGFWAWWATAADPMDRAIGEGSVQGWAEELTKRVQAIHEELAWELGPGLVSRHQLVVTAEGDPQQRATARRWLRGAPPMDATWEYADARQRIGSLEQLGLMVDDQELSLTDVVVGATREGNHFDVAVHHPSFAEPPSDSDRSVTFLGLDAALGELDVETWLGDVVAVSTRPGGAVPLGELRGLVTALAAEHQTEEGTSWALLQGETEEGPVLAAACVPLASATAPQLDQHVSVRVGYADRTETGLPTPQMLEALRQLEDQLAERLAPSGDLLAHETCAGTRELHFYVDSADFAATSAESVVRTTVAGWPHGLVEVTAEADPAWAAVAHLRT